MSLNVEEAVWALLSYVARGAPHARLCNINRHPATIPESEWGRCTCGLAQVIDLSRERETLR